jgi:hypothetical protein
LSLASFLACCHTELIHAAPRWLSYLAY